MVSSCLGRVEASPAGEVVVGMQRGSFLSGKGVHLFCLRGLSGIFCWARGVCELSVGGGPVET